MAKARWVVCLFLLLVPTALQWWIADSFSDSMQCARISRRRLRRAGPGFLNYFRGYVDLLNWHCVPGVLPKAVCRVTNSE